MLDILIPAKLYTTLNIMQKHIVQLKMVMPSEFARGRGCPECVRGPGNVVHGNVRRAMDVRLSSSSLVQTTGGLGDRRSTASTLPSTREPRMLCLSRMPWLNTACKRGLRVMTAATFCQSSLRSCTGYSRRRSLRSGDGELDSTELHRGWRMRRFACQKLLSTSAP